ncbi:hypothetical protein QJS66_07580 [Kocuria rhizophila]|nr:hypothetical protein QJS66_07580 [Kocuria rhizophila]
MSQGSGWRSPTTTYRAARGSGAGGAGHAPRIPGRPIYTTLYDPDGPPQVPGGHHHHLSAQPGGVCGVATGGRCRFFPGLLLDARARGRRCSCPRAAGRTASAPTASARCTATRRARWVYLLEQYLGSAPSSSPTGWAMLLARPLLERWDRRAMSSVQRMVANSTVVGDRIKRSATGGTWRSSTRRTACRTAGDRGRAADGGFRRGRRECFLSVSRLLPYKTWTGHGGAARPPDRRLVLVGAGSLEHQLRQLCRRTCSCSDPRHPGPAPAGRWPWWRRPTRTSVSPPGGLRLRTAHPGPARRRLPGHRGARHDGSVSSRSPPRRPSAGCWTVSAPTTGTSRPSGPTPAASRRARFVARLHQVVAARADDAARSHP